MLKASIKCLTIALLVLVGPHLYATDIYLVRHFEKEVSSDQSNSKNPRLTTLGQKQARQLATFLADKNITAIYSSNYYRTLDSAEPSATDFKLRVQLYDPSKLILFAKKLKNLKPDNGAILIVGHSNTTPELLALLGGPVIALSEKDYGDIFILNEKSKDFRHLNIHDL